MIHDRGFCVSRYLTTSAEDGTVGLSMVADFFPHQAGTHDILEGGMTT